MKKNVKIGIGIFVGILIGISTTVGAATVFNSKDITYESDKTDATNVKDSLDELYSKVSTGGCPEGKWCYDIPMTITEQVKLGDYISMTPTATSYSIPTSLTGYTSSQTINPSELNLWRVMKKNDDGTIDIVSEYVSSKKIYFKGKNGYINLIGTLNKIASQYTNDTYVQNTRYVGYSNQTETITNTSKLTQTTAPWINATKFRTDDSSCDESRYLCGLDEELGAGDLGYKTDFIAIKTSLKTMKASKVGTTSTSGEAYWVATREYRLGSIDNWYYEVGHQDPAYPDSWSMEVIYKHESKYTETSLGYAIRPVLTLKPKVTALSGDGTINNPYKF